MRDTYKYALQQILESGEIDKILKTVSFRERRQIKRYLKMINNAKSQGVSLMDMPIIPLVYHNNSTTLWKDLFFFMSAMKDGEK